MPKVSKELREELKIDIFLPEGMQARHSPEEIYLAIIDHIREAMFPKAEEYVIVRKKDKAGPDQADA